MLGLGGAAVQAALRAALSAALPALLLPARCCSCPNKPGELFSAQGCPRMCPQLIYKTAYLKFSDKALVGLQHSQNFPWIGSHLSASYPSRPRLGFSLSGFPLPQHFTGYLPV